MQIKTQISKPIAQMVEEPWKILNIPQTQDKVMTIHNFTIPLLQSKGDSGTKTIDRKMIHDVARETPSTQIQFIDPFLNQLKHLYMKFLEAYWTLTQN